MLGSGEQIWAADPERLEQGEGPGVAQGQILGHAPEFGQCSIE
jgi:hypothetical protein